MSSWNDFYETDSDDHIFSCKKHKEIHYELIKIALLDQLNITKGMKILDYGCGKAEYLNKDKIFREINFFLYDKSLTVLKSNKESYKTKIVNLPFIQNKKKYFDRIIISSVIQYLTKKEFEALIVMIYKTLMPNGVIAIIDVPREISIYRELIENVNNAIKRKYLIKYCFFIGKKIVATFRGLYIKNPLTRYSEDYLKNLCLTNGMKIKITENFILNKKRMTVLISK